MNEPQTNPYSPPSLAPPLQAVGSVAALMQREGEYSVEFEFTLNDAIAFSEYHLAQSPLHRRQFYLMWMAVAATFLGCAFIFAFAPRPNPPSTSGMLMPYFFGGMGLFWLFFYPWRRRSKLRRALTRAWTEGRNKGTFGPSRFTFDATGVCITSWSGGSLRYWRAVDKIAQNRDYLFIYQNAVMAYVVPRRAFVSDEDFQQFAAAARRYLEQAPDA